MPADVNPALRAELKAAQAVVVAQVRGLEDFINVSLSPEAKGVVQEQITVRSKRRDLIAAVIKALDAVMAALASLEVDGYPALSDAEISAGIFEEIKEQVRDMETAAGVFGGPAMASSINIMTGAPVAKK